MNSEILPWTIISTAVLFLVLILGYEVHLNHIENMEKIKKAPPMRVEKIL